MEEKRRKIKKREALAISPDALHTGPDAIWWDLGTAVPENERCGDVAVVHVRGSLEHHPGFGGDSYEGILARAENAFCGGDGEDGPPSAVVLRIDSPGGVCSGLNETVFALRKLASDTGIPMYAYVDELAASAAYALACACDAGIVMPASAICGSIGVISTLYDQVKADKDMGLNFVTLTSGARKADGHPHVPVSDAAVAAEQGRVDKLATQFYELVADVRPLSVNEAKALQAGIFLAAKAVDIGLADVVAGWPEFLEMLGETKPLANQTKNVQPASNKVQSAKVAHYKPGDTKMLLTLKAQIKRAQTALDAEKDPKERKSIAARITAYTAALEAYKKEKYTKETVEKHSSEESEEAEGEGEAAAESESDEAAAESGEEDEAAESKGNETDRKQEGDDGDGDDEGEDEAAAKKAAKAALAGGASGRQALGTISAAFAKAAKYDALNARVAKIEANARRAEKVALIDEAFAQRRITRDMAKTLRGKSIDFVKGTLEMHKTAMVHIDEESLAVPDGSKSNADLPANVLRSVDVAVNAAVHLDAAGREKFRTELITAQRERLAQANGAGGRY